MEITLPDIQSSEPTIKRPINQVGVENVELPFLLESKYGGFDSLTAKVSMRTSLDANIKGISMSRFLRTLKKYLNKPLKKVLMKKILQDFRSKVGSDESFIKFIFKLPINRKSPISDYKFPIYYSCRFEGQLLHDGQFKFFEGVKIQYASYCPCSAELCQHLNLNSKKGFPHNQRSFADILVEVNESEYVWLEDIIEAVESKIKTLPYPIIKRVDEQEIARIASENPLFVEDAIRIISDALDELPIADWIVKCIHEESIHTSEAIAVNWKGAGNFDGTRFI